MEWCGSEKESGGMVAGMDQGNIGVNAVNRCVCVCVCVRVCEVATDERQNM